MTDPEGDLESTDHLLKIKLSENRTKFPRNRYLSLKSFLSGSLKTQFIIRADVA